MPRPKSDGLTMREREVVFFKLQGYSYNQIAAILDISYSRVRNHITEIYCKLDIATHEELCTIYQERAS